MRPVSVSGMSVSPVWRPRRAHSVSPWRTSQACCSGSGILGGGVDWRGLRHQAGRAIVRALELGGVGREELARSPTEERRQESAGDLGDARVVAVDLVVVELSAVGDHRLEPLDLVLQVGDVRCRLDVRVALHHREQRSDGGSGRFGGHGLVVDRGRRGVRRARLGHPGQDVALEGHQTAHRCDQVRQLIVALLQDDVDVRPRLVDPLPERHDSVVTG